MNVTHDINVAPRIEVKPDIVRIRIREQFSGLRRTRHLTASTLKEPQPSVMGSNVLWEIPRLRLRMVHGHFIHKISPVVSRLKSSESCVPRAAKPRKKLFHLDIM